jgi:hypothetical protein
MNEEETKGTKRSKKSANYALEQYGEKSAEGLPVWLEVKDGFVSVVKALEYAESNKIQGAIRVVRVASPIYGGEVVTPEPVYTLKKIEPEEKPARKPRQPRKASRPAEGTVAPAATESVTEPPATEPPVVEALPPEDDGESTDPDAL